MTRPLIALTLAALAIAGCADPASKLVGTYKGTADLPKDYTDELARQGITGGENMAVVTLDLNSDGTCKMTTVGGGQTRTQDGDWEYDASDKVVTLRITSPFLRKEDLDEMKAKGMSDEMIAKSTKNPMNSQPVGEDGKLVFKIVQSTFDLSISFTKEG